MNASEARVSPLGAWLNPTLFAGRVAFVTSEIPGRARFTCDGETVELVAGEMMHVSSEVVRDAVALEDSTLVLCVGGTPGQPYSPS